MITCTDANPCGNEMMGLLGLFAVALFVLIMVAQEIIRRRSGR